MKTKILLTLSLLLIYGGVIQAADLQEFKPEKGKAYTMKVADSDLYFSLDVNVGEKAKISTALTSVYFTAETDEEGKDTGKFAISTSAGSNSTEDNQTIYYLNCSPSNSWDTQKSTTEYYWTFEPIELKDKVIAYRLKRDGTDNVYVGNDSHSKDNKELFCDLPLSKGTEIINWIIEEDSRPEEEIIKGMISTLASDVRGMLTEIANAYGRLEEKFLEDGVGLKAEFPKKIEGADVTWPGEYKDYIPLEDFKGIDSYFDLLSYAEEAVKTAEEATITDTDAKDIIEKLENARFNLSTFIDFTKRYDYPISVSIEVSKEYEYTTAYLPINATCPSGLSIYECTGMNGNVLVLTKWIDEWKNNNFGSNRAYIVKNDKRMSKTFQFIGYGNAVDEQKNPGLLYGTHKEITAPKGSYVLQYWGDLGLNFYIVGDEEIKVPAGKCYLKLDDKTQGLKALLFPDGTSTSIEALDAAAPKADSVIYDLSGRRVNVMGKGVYIVNGKKILVK